MRNKSSSPTISRETIEDIPLSDAISDRYLTYALSIIMSRSLPDVRDGLKPVHRRLLYAMRQLKLDPSGVYKKCARVVGDVIGKYHPHGDQAVYDALVRLAQEFAARYPLIDGQGNFGNLDGDNAAAMRYTEARLTEEASALLEGIDEDAVDFRQTYDGEENEPIVLPAAFPNLLANGAMGIAVGMATNIPPHNVGEICTALIHLINFPKATFGKLLEMIPGPDFPTGGILVEDKKSLLAAYKIGRGGFRVRAKWSLEKLERGQFQIIITEIPFQVQKAKLIEKIADLLILKKLPMLNDVFDESAEDVRIVLEPKNRSIDPVHLMEQLYNQTDLETRFSLNMNVIDSDNTPRVMNLREVLQAFLEHRLQVLTRRTTFRLGKINNRLDVLNAYLIAYLNLDEVIRIIREMDDAKSALIKTFKLNENQAESILNMRLRRLRKLEELEIKSEYEGLREESKLLKSLLKNRGLQKKHIKSEIAEIKRHFGNKSDSGKRRTEIGEPPPIIDVPIDSVIEKEPITVICSEKDWIRAAKGHLLTPVEAKYKDGDGHKFFLHSETTDTIMLFATDGRFYTIPCNKLPSGRGFGEPLRLITGLSNEHNIVSLFIYKPGEKILVASNSGRGFIVKTDEIYAQTKIGKQVLNIKEKDKAIACCKVEGDHVAVIGENRKLLLFPLEEVPEMTRGRGVIFQRYNKGGLADVKTIYIKEGLNWQSGNRIRTELDIKEWLGKRAQAGKLPPKGFSSKNRFS